jgi:hypothetical protein
MLGRRVRIEPGIQATPSRRSQRLRIEPLEARHLLAFTAGNVVVERAGDGFLANSTAQPLALLEFANNVPNQSSPVSIVGLPSSTTGANNQGWVTDGAGSSTNGYLHRSVDGQYLTLIGYDAVLGTQGVSISDAATVNRNVARIDAAGNVTIAARLADSYTTAGGNARSAVSTDGNSIWTGGSSSTGVTNGVRFADASSVVPTTSVQVAGGSIRDVAIYGGILFAATQQTLSSFGSLPTTSSSGTTLPGLAGLLSDIGGFALLDRSPTAGATGLNGLDTLYVNDGTGIGVGNLRKFEWNSSTSQWAARGTATINTGGLFALTGVINGSNVELYATGGLGPNNALHSFTDTASFGSEINGNFTTLAQAGAGFVFRGVALSPVAAAEDTLRVTNFAWNASGFEVTFNRAPNSGVLNLYDSIASSANPQPPSLRPADVTLVGAIVGNVKGSLIPDSSGRKFTFVKSGGVLAPDNYTATLFSRSDAFQDATGLLDGDGDLNGAELNDHYVAMTTVAASNSRVLSIRDLARGPGQHVDDTSNPKLAVRLSDATNVTRIVLRVSWDASLLNVFTDFQQTTTRLAPGLPPGWSLVVDPGGLSTVVLIAQGTTPLAGNDVPIIWLEAIVPQSALGGAAGLIHVSNVSINNGAIPAMGDLAVQSVSYLGDADGNKTYTGYDAALIARVALGHDSGFRAYPLIDPAILASTSGTATLVNQDATLVAMKSVFLPVPAIPDLPVILVGSGSLAVETTTPAQAPLVRDEVSTTVATAAPVLASPKTIVGPLRQKSNTVSPAPNLAVPLQNALATSKNSPRVADQPTRLANHVPPSPQRLTLVPQAVDAILTASTADRSRHLARNARTTIADELEWTKLGL